VLTTILQRRGVDTSATETLRAALSESASLATLVPRHDHASRLGEDARYRTQLARHAPATLGHDAERALIQTLRNAHDAGHHTADLLTNRTLTRRLTAADDPAAVLAARITAHIDQHPPTVPHTVQPDPSDVRRWRRIVTTSLTATRPAIDLAGPEWERVWRAATSGRLRGLDPDAALYDATGRIAQRPEDPLLPDHVRLTSDLNSALGDQQRRGLGHQPALPWLARIDFATVNDHDGVRAYLADINTAIATRTRALRDTTIADPPDWAHALGPRPTEPELAQRWDHLVGLAAAYRDLYTIDDAQDGTTDLAPALGPEVKGTGPQARAWRTITAQWHALQADTAGPRHQLDYKTGATINAGASTAAVWPAPQAPGRETVAAAAKQKPASLAEWIRQHDEIARHGDLARYRDLVAVPVPNALNRPAEVAVIRALRTANDLGWQPEHLLANPAITGGLDTVDDPAALLAWRINNHTQTRTPPQRTREPAPDDVARWQNIVRTEHPGVDLEHPDWHHAWRIAAAAPIDGLNPDDAVRAAATTARSDATVSPGDAMIRALRTQRFSVTAYRPALPWLARPDHTTLTPTQIARLHQLNNAIRTQTNRLRDNTTTNRPEWTSQLGPRPANPRDVHRWNRALELAAAYRATHQTRSANPDQPLGPPPPRHSPHHHARNTITTQWRTLMPRDNPMNPDRSAQRASQPDHATARVAASNRAGDDTRRAGELTRRREEQRREDARRRHVSAAESDIEHYGHLDHERHTTHDRSSGNSLGY